ncbi:MAG TPA: hypothetical protein VEI03_24440 [Stellaceae bacterium]|nr:hypothetical protein [Stellaceae bacterium]
MADALLTREPPSRSSLAELISHARAELETAVSFDHVKAIRDQADALRGYAKSIGAAQAALNAVAEIKIRAERRMGRELAALDMHPGGRPPKTGDTASPVSKPTLAALGIHKKWSQRWQALARIPPATFEACLFEAKRNGEELTTAGLNRAAARILRNDVGRGPPPAPDARDAVERQLEALERAWAAAGDAARRMFLERRRLDRPPPVSRPVVRLAASGAPGETSPQLS